MGRRLKPVSTTDRQEIIRARDDAERNRALHTKRARIATSCAQKWGRRARDLQIRLDELGRQEARSLLDEDARARIDKGLATYTEWKRAALARGCCKCGGALPEKGITLVDDKRGFAHQTCPKPPGRLRAIDLERSERT